MEEIEEEFTFKATQEATTYFRGNLTVKALNKQHAMEIIENASQVELENMVKDWELTESGADATGPVEVYDDDGVIINEL